MKETAIHCWIQLNLQNSHLSNCELSKERSLEVSKIANPQNNLKDALKTHKLRKSRTSNNITTLLSIENFQLEFY